MVRLYDEATGTLLGEISDQEFQVLTSTLEEESSEDTNYYFTRDTLDLLAERGLSQPVQALLLQAIGSAGEAEVRWERV